jgi:hypothetical protein
MDGPDEQKIRFTLHSISKIHFFSIDKQSIEDNFEYLN